MKLLQNAFFVLVLVCLIFSCKKDEEVIPQVENRPPAVFVVTVAPDENSALISWTAATDPDGDQVLYSVFLESDTLAEGISEQMFNVEDLEYETLHVGSIVAKDSKGLKRKVDFEFTTGIFPNAAPTDFTLLSPNDNAANLPLSPNFNWGDSFDPEGGSIVYDVYLDTSNPPLNQVAAEIDNPSYSGIPDLTPASTYYWKVIAKDDLGAETSSEVFNFTTQDVANATLINSDPGFGNRDVHSSLAFDNKLWIIGGRNGSGRYSDVWYSEDGNSWTLATDTPGWVGRAAHACVVFDNKMWIMGGNTVYSPGGELNDIWYSEDGFTWVEATSSPAWEPRYSLQAEVLDGKMWIFGGLDQDFTFSRQQAWSSVDGINWILESDDTGVNYDQSDLVSFEGQVWKISGGYNSIVESTSNGVDWNIVIDNAPYGARLQSTTAIHDNKMWLISGSNFLVNQFNELSDIWYSEDGVIWVEASDFAGFPGVASATSVSFNGGIYLIGGGGGWQDTFITDDVYLIDF